MTYDEQTWVDGVSVVNAATLGHIEAGIKGAHDQIDASITSVNGDPGDTAGAVTLNLNSLVGVDIDAVQTNDDGTPVDGTGPQPGDYLAWNPVTQEWENGPVTGFAPEGWEPPFFKPIAILGVGDTLPATFPDDGLVFDETKPSAPLYAVVNTVAASTATLTLPAPATANLHDVTLTANCTLTFPTAAVGASFRLLLRQDATGSRTVTWPVGTKWSGGSAPTLSTAAGTEDLIEFLSVGTTSWRQVGPVDHYTA